MSALQAHIKTLNAETLAWVAEDSANRWAGLLVEDLEHWAEYGIYTVAQFNRYMDECAYSDGYKEVYGVRPHFIADMDDAELRDALDSLCAASRAEEEHLAHLDRLDAEDRRLSVMENPAPYPYEDWDR